MKIGSLQYAVSPGLDFKAYARKITTLIEEYASKGVELLLFPEYAGEEQHQLNEYLQLFTHLSRTYKMYICSGTLPIKDKKGTFNRAHLFAPSGKVGHQDKCLLTPYEVAEGVVEPAHQLKIFETSLGRIAICICYDIEFSGLVGKILAQEVDLLLVPSYTKSVAGFYRVFLSCRARAIEGQCYVIQSCMVGPVENENTYGAAAICTPVDQGFPEDGLLALGERDEIGGVIGALDLDKLKIVRQQGETHNFIDAQKLQTRPIELEITTL